MRRFPITQTNKRYVIAAAISGLALIGGSFAIIHAYANNSATAAVPPAASVDVAIVETRNIIDWHGYSGRLEAVAIRGGAPAERTAVHTAGERRRLALTAERPLVRADGRDMAFVVVELVDDDGVRATDSDVEVELTIDGPGALQGFGSAIPATEESFTDLRHRLYDGRALAVIRPSGNRRRTDTRAPTSRGVMATTKAKPDGNRRPRCRDGPTCP